MIRALGRKGYRDAYVAQHIKRGLATQIRGMREDREWTQAELAAKLMTKQSAIARLEDEDYGRYSLQSLVNVASVFDVALMVRFVPFSELLRYTAHITPHHLSPVDYNHDAALYVSAFPDSTSSASSVLRASSQWMPLETPGSSVTAMDVYWNHSATSSPVAHQEANVLGGYRR